MLSVLYCAHKVAPTGGPEDKTPPQIIKNFPNADSVGIRKLNYIEIEFDEAIRQSTLLGNYWIVPEVNGGLEVKWKGGKKVRFYVPDSLAKNQTYVFTLGTGVKDMHNNALEAPFQLAFSTGKKLDNGLITGSVYADKKVQDVFIYGYPIVPQTDLDSLLFREAKYYTQIDVKGNYRLNYLPYGAYRVIALKDEDYNYIYNKGTDLIGIPFTDVSLDSIESSFQDLNFFLIEEDSIGPDIRSIDTVSRREIKIEFNEPVQWSGFDIEINDTSGNLISRPIAFSFDRSTKTSVKAYFKDLPEKTPAILYLSGAKDLSGNPSKPAVLQKNFFTPTRPDTLLRSDIQYTITMELSYLLDLFGRHFPDTTIISTFKTEDLANLGEISGNVDVPDSSWKKSIVWAKPLRGTQDYSVEGPVVNPYQINYLPASSYLMDCVIDVNDNGIWDKGETSPWHFAEPYTTLPDTVRVRKRWTTKGINIAFIFRKSE
ncbi:MAG: Ig-like domain-containing protein [Calditrichota bacterium]